MSFGYHLLLDCGECDIEQISSYDNIYTFIKEIVKRIDMIAVGEPIIKMMCVGDPKVGYSVVQLIETSNITIHFMEVTGEAYVDVFSCKYFEPAVAEDCFKEFFSPGTVHSKFLVRDAKENSLLPAY